MRAQHLLNARQPANVLRRVLPAGRLVVIQFSFILVVLIFCLSMQYVCFDSCLFLSASRNSSINLSKRTKLKIYSPQFIVFFSQNALKTVKPGKKTMYCDRSAYYQKAIKATARQLKIFTNLQWFFLLFGRLVSVCYFLL